MIGSLCSIVIDIRITRCLMTTPSRVENTQLRIRGSCLTNLKRSETAPVINCKNPAANAKDVHEYMQIHNLLCLLLLSMSFSGVVFRASHHLIKRNWWCKSTNQLPVPPDPPLFCLFWQFKLSGTKNSPLRSGCHGGAGRSMRSKPSFNQASAGLYLAIASFVS